MRGGKQIGARRKPAPERNTNNTFYAKQITMNKVTIKNDFANTSITVDASKKLTARKIKSWRSKLISAGCCSGDDLGGRGKQDDQTAYEALSLRAYYVLVSKKDEI